VTAYERKRELPVGVYQNRVGGRYMAVCRHHGKRHYLGMFDTAQEADERMKAFREENPMGIRKWQPGDKV
jgi:hypothetical protein